MFQKSGWPSLWFIEVNDGIVIGKVVQPTHQEQKRTQLAFINLMIGSKFERPSLFISCLPNGNDAVPSTSFLVKFRLTTSSLASLSLYIYIQLKWTSPLFMAGIIWTTDGPTTQSRGVNGWNHTMCLVYGTSCV